MFWQKTSFTENMRQTAYNVHSFHLLGEWGQTLTLVGGPETGHAWKF